MTRHLAILFFQYPRLDRFLWNDTYSKCHQCLFRLSVSSTGSFSLELISYSECSECVALSVSSTGSFSLEPRKRQYGVARNRHLSVSSTGSFSLERMTLSLRSLSFPSFSILDWIVFSGTSKSCILFMIFILFFQYPRLDRFLWNIATVELPRSIPTLSVSSTGSFSLEPYTPLSLMSSILTFSILDWIVFSGTPRAKPWSVAKSLLSVSSTGSFSLEQKALPECVKKLRHES